MKGIDIIYAPLLDAYAKAMSPADVERLFEDMLKADGKPTLTSMTIMLDAYRRTGDIEGVMRVWPVILQLGMTFSEVDTLLEDQDKNSKQFKSQRRSDVLCVPLSIYMNAVSNAGHHLEVARAWNRLRTEGFQFDPSNWNHLAVAMVRAGQPERAFEVIEKVILPYQDYSESDARDEPDELDSPLILDTEEKEPGQSHTSLHTAKRQPARRVDAKTAFMEVDVESAREAANTDEDDFAFELHVLHTSTPTWHLWRPHARTLTALSDALHCLRSGRLVQPTRPRAIPDKDGFTDSAPDDRSEVDEIQQASEVLQRIYRDFPRSVRAVESWDSSDRRQWFAK